MKILFVGAHPDDIEFSCSGTIARLSKDNDVFGLVVTDGGDAAREKETRKALSLCGVREVRVLCFTDGYIRDDKGTISLIQEEIESFAPDIVVTHYPDDSHQDHRMLARVVRAAVRRRISLAYFDSYSAIGFTPNVFIDISDYAGIKKRAIVCHASQVKKYADRGIDFSEYALAKNRVYGFEAGCKLAEGFVAEGVRL